MKEPLPEFENPPVIEVVLSVQFEPLKRLKAAHLGLFWSELRDRYPNCEEKPPLSPSFESFETPSFPRELDVRVETTPPMPRIWFKNEAGTALIQIQQDRFIYNWIKTNEPIEYKRYVRIKETFERELNIFLKFLGNEKLGDVVPNQAEITYINSIIGEEIWSDLSEADKFLTVFKPKYSDHFLGHPENLNMLLRYIIRDDQDKPIGRLHVSVEPKYRRVDKKPLYSLTLTARGIAAGEGLNCAFDFIEIGHEWIVKGFKSLTTPEMHQKIWRIKNG
jgi:uncharacterized protein (TIGR04255 family)